MLRKIDNFLLAFLVNILLPLWGFAAIGIGIWGTVTEIVGGNLYTIIPLLAFLWLGLVVFDVAHSNTSKFGLTGLRKDLRALNRN